jgi:hypothetical protein
MKIIGKIRKAVSYIFILPISAYRKFISPLFPQTCKYYPSCSAYAIEAYKKHGAVIGTVLTIWRLLRCNPFSYGGVDYVPEKIDIGYFIPKNLKKKK